jgi:hypothetical protein
VSAAPDGKRERLPGRREAGAAADDTSALPDALGDMSLPAAALPEILMRTSREITAVLDTLHRSRDFLERAAVPRLRRTNLKLLEASEATESATHELLDGLDRSLVLIDELGRQLAHQGAWPDGFAHKQSELRTEVHRLINSLQVQDIVAQQIAFAMRVLQDTERRMIAISEYFDVAVFGRTESATVDEANWAHEFDTGATMARGPERQALADTIFQQQS